MTLRPEQACVKGSEACVFLHILFLITISLARDDFLFMSCAKYMSSPNSEATDGNSILNIRDSVRFLVDGIAGKL